MALNSSGRSMFTRCPAPGDLADVELGELSGRDERLVLADDEVSAGPEKSRASCGEVLAVANRLDRADEVVGDAMHQGRIGRCSRRRRASAA